MRVLRVVTFWMLADVRRRIHRLFTNLDVIDREIEALLMSKDN